MENNEKLDLRAMLVAGREKKGLSQRKLAKKIGVHHSTLNDMENGRIKKIDVGVLGKIADELDLNLEMLLKASGYSQVAYMFEQKSSLNSKTPKTLKELIGQYRASQLDLLDDAYQKRTKVRDCRTRINSLITKLEDYDFYKTVWTMDKIVEELKDINKELLLSAEKYDYSKLPKDEL